jgi:hypothetical protein
MMTKPAAPIPPHDLALERGVLGAGFHSAASVVTIAAAPPELFYSGQHRAVQRALASLAPSLNGAPPDLALVRRLTDDQGDPVDLVVLTAMLEAGMHVIDITQYLVELRELAARREQHAVQIMLSEALARDAAGHDPQLWLAVHERLGRARALRMPGSSGPVVPLGEGVGVFLARMYPPPQPLIDGVLSSDGSGWIAGEEKLMKTIYALHEGVCLALAEPVAGAFPVPVRRRVLFIEEEDPPRRTQIRVAAGLRGLGRDPDDSAVLEDLNDWFRIAVWEGFTFDEPAMLARLEATIDGFRPDVVYLDVLRKLTRRDLNKAVEAGPMLAVMDDLRRRYGCVFRVLHHYRKSQGFRTGRGSQELGGSFTLGAWGECSLFFEPIGRKQGLVQVEVQTKDGAPVPGFRLTVTSEGPHASPTVLRITATEVADDQSADDLILQAVAIADKTEAIVGRAGVSVATLTATLKKSDKTIRRGLKRLIESKAILVTGHASKQSVLYGVNE